MTNLLEHRLKMLWVDLIKVSDKVSDVVYLVRMFLEQNFPIGLLQIGLNEDCEVSVRQSCSVLLKNWIESHWSTASEKFKVYFVQNQIDSGIKSV